MGNGYGRPLLITRTLPHAIIGKTKAPLESSGAFFGGARSDERVGIIIARPRHRCNKKPLAIIARGFFVC
jgi:hypothetical protein